MNSTAINEKGIDFEDPSTNFLSSSAPLDRRAALRLASELVIQLHQRVSGDRFREQKGDRTRVAYARALVAALQAYGVLLRDNEIEILEQRLEALEARSKSLELER